jgi:ABC-2 type transport system ATP-binding protein
MPAILEVDNLVKKYGDFVAVKGISFSVNEGEVFGLLGPNGAGKTQTISMLTGVIPPSSGTARIGGHDLLTDREQVKQINGLVPQELALYPTLSARANLNFFGRIYGLHGRELKERVDDVLDIVALTERANQAVEKYSGGMKRRVNIGAGLLHYPRLLFLDEPTVGVDPQSRNQIFESVQQLNRERGMSVVYTSHYMEEVELLCNRVAIIDQGQIIALDTIKNLIAILGGGVLMVGVSQVDDAMLKEISSLTGVKSASLIPAAIEAAPAEAGKEAPAGAPTGPQLKIECENSQLALINLISYMAEKDRRITALDILEPNLESVFLHLTGKKLRE